MLLCCVFMSKMMRIDSTDQQIIALLMADGRSSFREVGEVVSLTPSAVKRRVDRLVRDGVITSFSARISPEALGWNAQAFVAVTYAGNVSPDEIRDILSPIPQVVGAYTVAGDADVLVHIRSADMADFEQALERLRASDAVARTVSMVVLSTLIDRSAVPEQPVIAEPTTAD